MATAKDCHTLTSYFISSYTEKYGRKPIVNRNVARWSWDNILQDLTMVECRDLVDYYMKTDGNHGNSLPWFFGHYDQLMVNKKSQDEDAETRALLREETKRRTEEWRKKNANSRRETD